MFKNSVKHGVFKQIFKQYGVIAKNKKIHLQNKRYLTQLEAKW